MYAPRIKRKLALTLLLSLSGLCGCAHQYLMKISDGDQIVAASKPKLQGTRYYFKDDTGVTHVIPQSRVVKIETISVVKQREEEPSSPAMPKKPKHWYFLWLA